MKPSWSLTAILALLLGISNTVWFFATRSTREGPLASRVPVTQEHNMDTREPGRWVKKTAFVMPLLPEALNVDPYFAALLHCAAFLELSDDDAVDPDAAVEVMESMHAYLQRLPAQRVNELRAASLRVAQHSRGSGNPPDFVTFLDGFVEGAGLGPGSE
jgi:hypothetical protein